MEIGSGNLDENENDFFAKIEMKMDRGGFGLNYVYSVL